LDESSATSGVPASLKELKIIRVKKPARTAVEASSFFFIE
jgi:hypothetical protein